MKFVRGFFASVLTIIFVAIVTCSIGMFALNSFIKTGMKEVLCSPECISVIVHSTNTDKAEQKYIEKVFEIPETKQVFDKIADQLMDFYFYNGEKPKITAEDVDAVCNSAQFEEKLDIKLPPEQKQELVAKFKESLDDLNKKLTQELNRNQTSIIIGKFTSTSMLIYVIASLTALYLLIALCRKSWRIPLLWTGIATVSGASLNFIMVYIIAGIMGKEFDDGLLKVLFDKLFSNWTTSAAITLIVGIVFIIANFIIPIFPKKEAA